MIASQHIDLDSFIPVIGHEDIYSVNKKGEVYSKYKKGILKPKLGNTGYLMVNIRQKWTYLHRIVAASFFGESKLHVNHKDGNKINNNLENLEWCTRSENMRHAFRTGLVDPSKIKRKVRNHHPKAKLTWDQVNEIRAKYIPHIYGCVKLGKEYGLHDTTILDIVKFKIWKPILSSSPTP